MSYKRITISDHQPCPAGFEFRMFAIVAIIAFIWALWEGFHDESIPPISTADERQSVLEGMRQPVAMAYPDATVWKEIKK